MLEAESAGAVARVCRTQQQQQQQRREEQSVPKSKNAKTRGPVVAAAARGGDYVFRLSLKLMLPPAAASCAAFSFAAACGRGIAAAALWLTVCALLGCRCYSYEPGTLFFIYASSMVCRVAAHPYIPPQFRRRCLQYFFLPLAQTHLNLGGKAIHFF